jgi:small subunit ribosomal protein S19
MPRSLKKGPFVEKYLPKKIELAKKEANPAKRVISTYSRRSMVIEQMVGHKLGEFSHTRTYHGHTGERKK